MAQARGGRFLDDAQSLEALIDAMPQGLREEYRTYGALTLEAAFPNRRMIVYTLTASGPRDLRMLTLGDVQFDRVSGPVLHVQDEEGPIRITPVPCRYRDRDLFFHVPQNFTFKWKAKESPTGLQFAPHIAVLIKTRSKEHRQIDGHTYCATLNDFWTRFPGLKDQVRY